LQLEISRASGKDMREILDIQKLAFRENAVRYDDPDITQLTDTLDDFLEKVQGYTVLKAVVDGRIVGSVKGRQNGDVCRISNLIVHPDHWNRGIGHGLMAAIENEFDADVFELVTGYKDHKNISLYEGLGYRITEGYLERVTERLYFIHMSKRIT
jgi:ribosomal protein S18 acetylase RimI-like enzyme